MKRRVLSEITSMHLQEQHIAEEVGHASVLHKQSNTMHSWITEVLQT